MMQCRVREVILPRNLLLRGCVLRNTKWVVGLVLNTGPDTKIIMSSLEVKRPLLLVSWASGRLGMGCLFCFVFCVFSHRVTWQSPEKLLRYVM